MGWVLNPMTRVVYPGETDPKGTVHKAGWAPDPDPTIEENLVPTGIRSTDRPTRSELLY